MTILDWPQDDRPRERLIRLGASHLSDAELLAVFLRTGVTGKSAVDLARDLLKEFGSLSGMFAAPLSEFCRIHGLGQAKFAQLQAVLELSKRAIREELEEKVSLSNPQAVKDYLHLLFANRTYECFCVLFLDVQNKLITTEEMFRGTLTQASVYPREVAVRALHHHAASVIVAHNHPSGNCDPSAADKQLTAQLQQALQLLEIRVLDHFIVARAGIFSFAERGLL
ncbi:RadC family protein [Undibacterium luofuense]|uniref:DNA repair protein RadC n=1 Tax=Undibacterium luofuense TaxID=2828733 RepID=A0A941DL29_9BURK|nr:DNA repair protein RadC [Undibacterium luofuense]MBR7782803.1 DNA repair protein RadC [Undibacterium luofuense]